MNFGLDSMLSSGPCAYNKTLELVCIEGIGCFPLQEEEESE